ncbi:MAG TPA: efflux transporter outer membrane subunit [Steroidobacteraceae bacterium]|nr:efflux transporter outer membrane subunit [Steroidobacteraceae bacterium]
MRGAITAAVLLACGLHSGCTVGPDYVRPEIEAPEKYRFAVVEANDLANTEWWKQFHDSTLDELISIALSDNFDVRIAAARVDEFYGNLGVTRSGKLPQVGAEAAVGSARTPPNAAADSVRVDAFASWEIDLFGRLRRLTEASRADLLASEEGRRFAVLTLVSTVASTYITLLGVDAQLDIARRTLLSRAEAMRIFEARYKRGASSEFELSQSRSEYAVTKSTIPPLEQAQAQIENALALLLGRNPGPIARTMKIDSLGLPIVPAGLPSEILERRPDIKQAELNLIAANARIGAAKALYYPSISLTGLFGSVSNSFDTLFTGPAELYSYGAAVAGPIFTGGAISGQVSVAEARQQQTLLAYQRAIRTAFRDVENALIASQKSREALLAQKERVDSMREYARLANLRYDNGYSGYLEVLDAERGLFAAELDYTQAKSETFFALVNIYASMGGGWVVDAAALAAQPRVDMAQDPKSFP